MRQGYETLLQRAVTRHFRETPLQDTVTRRCYETRLQYPAISPVEILRQNAQLRARRLRVRILHTAEKRQKLRAGTTDSSGGSSLPKGKSGRPAKGMRSIYWPQARIYLGIRATPKRAPHNR
jgi:hypothetical protein